MSKKIFIIILAVILILGLSFVLIKGSNINKVEEDNFIEKKAEDLKPISKESAIKILQAEYGMNIVNKEEDFKLEGKYYVVDVYIDLGSSQEHSQENLQDESNVMNLGINKINIYTGELIQE